MKSVSRTMVAISALILGLATLVGAQMMGGNQGQKTTQSATTASQSKDTPQQSKADSLAARMSNSWQMTSQDFDKLEREFQDMMKIDDMSKLKAEMEKYHQNMMLMRNDMVQEHDECQMMTAMMQSGNTNMQGMQNGRRMHGMMGMGQNGSQSSKTNSGNK